MWVCLKIGYTMENPPNIKNKSCASFQQETYSDEATELTIPYVPIAAHVSKSLDCPVTGAGGPKEATIGAKVNSWIY